MITNNHRSLIIDHGYMIIDDHRWPIHTLTRLHAASHTGTHSLSQTHPRIHKHTHVRTHTHTLTHTHRHAHTHKDHVIPFVKKRSLWHLVCSFRLGLNLAIYNPSSIRRLRAWIDARQSVFHVNLCSILSLTCWFRCRSVSARCFAGSNPPVMLSCSANPTCFDVFHMEDVEDQILFPT